MQMFIETEQVLISVRAIEAVLLSADGHVQVTLACGRVLELDQPDAAQFLEAMSMVNAREIHIAKARSLEERQRGGS